ncbi:MAG: ABC transporter permease [Candidatus Poribacteria bacterium]|nr:ABC transporter permease [Candidatus Poribacteria bacterium]
MAFTNQIIWLQSFIALWIVECKLFVRQPAAAFFTFIFPVLVFLLFGSIFGEAPMWNRPDVRYIDYYAPALMSAYIGQAGLTSLINFLTEYRLIGILKRYIISPLSLGFYLCVHIAMQVVIFIISAAILFIIAESVFDLHFRGHWVIVLLVGMICITCFFALGFLVSGLSKSLRDVRALGQFLFLVMFFISGATFPRQMFPDWLQVLSLGSPLTHVVSTFSGVWLGDPISQYMNSLLFLIIITILSYLISIRIFKWEV